MRGKVFWWTILWIFLCAVLTQAEWYPGLVHFHSTYSDGEYPPRMVKFEAKNMKNRFLMETDHYEQIAEPTKFGRITRDAGFDNYLSDFSSDDRLIVFAGAELSYYSGGHLTHTLALGDIEDDKELSELKSIHGALAMILARISKLDLLSVAAHPSSKSYPYDKECYTKPSGFEFLNEKYQEYLETLKWYLKNAEKDIFVTSGSDFHAMEDPTNSAPVRLSRKTYVWVDGELTKESIMDAFRQGHTYATQNGFRLKNLSFRPGFEWQQAPKASINLEVVCNKRLSRDTNLFLYRVPSSEPIAKIVLRKGKSQFDCTLVDPSLPKGKQTYVIAIDNQLVTSPIRLNIKPKPRKEIDSSTATHPRRIPLLMGKTKKEMFELMGSRGKFVPAYQKIFDDQYLFSWPEVLRISIAHSPRIDRVTFVKWEFTYQVQPTYKYKVRDTLPLEILNQEPVESNIVTSWNQFHLILSAQDPTTHETFFYDVYAGAKEKIYSITPSGSPLIPSRITAIKDWRDCYLVYFATSGLSKYKTKRLHN